MGKRVGRGGTKIRSGSSWYKADGVEQEATAAVAHLMMALSATLDAAKAAAAAIHTRAQVSRCATCPDVHVDGLWLRRAQRCTYSMMWSTLRAAVAFGWHGGVLDVRDGQPPLPRAAVITHPINHSHSVLISAGARARTELTHVTLRLRRLCERSR